MKKFTLIFSSVFFAAVFVLTTLSLQAETKRWVLVEEATNASCGPCASQNPTFQVFLNNHRDRIIPLVYHWDFPGPNDPMFLEDPTMNNGRIENYYQINGVPSGRMNGKIPTPVSSGWYDGAPGDTAALYATLNNQPTTSPFTMTIDEERTGNSGEITINIDALSAINGKKLRVAIVEYHIYDEDAGSNGETDFYWIARQMLPTHTGTTVNMEAGESKEFTFNYTMKSTWDPNQIYIVAFLQDDMTKEVLQAATNLKVAYAQAEISDPLTKIPRNGELTKTVTITNPNEFEATFNLELSGLPTGWVATLDKTEMTLAPGASDDAIITVNSSDQANFLIISVIATPVAEGYMGDPATSSFLTMTEDAKYVVWGGFNSGALYIMDGFAQNQELLKDVVYIPWNQVLTNYYRPADFDVAFYTVRNENAVTNSSQDGYLYPLYDELISEIKSMVNNGKSVFVSNEVTGYLINAYSGQLTQQEDFLKNFIGVNPTNTSLVRRWSGQNLTTFDLDGVTGDVIGNGISTQLNTSGYNYILFTDYLSIPNNSSAKPMFYYDNNNANIGAVRVEKTGGAKIIYSTFGLEAIADANTRGTIVTRIMEYFAGPVALGPVMTLSSTSLDFENVTIDDTEEKSFDINNEGDEDLIISKIETDSEWDPDGVFTISSGASNLPVTIAPGSKHTIRVKFAPEEDKEYSGQVLVSSNDPNRNEEFISLAGNGITSVFEENTSSNGLLSLSAGPNPFSGSTKITVNVGGSTTRNINLSVMDAAGRIVANLANETMAPGVYVKDFNADALASGIYYIVGTTDGAAVRLQVVLNK